MKPILVFYAGLLYGEYTWEEFRNLQVTADPEIYNGGYLYNPIDLRAGVVVWYRMDGTPMLLEDVPKPLRTLVLLLT